MRHREILLTAMVLVPFGVLTGWALSESPAPSTAAEAGAGACQSMHVLRASPAREAARDTYCPIGAGRSQKRLLEQALNIDARRSAERGRIP